MNKRAKVKNKTIKNPRKHKKITHKNKHIFTIMRKFRDISLACVKTKDGKKIFNVSAYERLEKLPFVETVEKLANAIGADPEVLYYSFGLMPRDVVKIITSDPFYYNEKIKELCNNHEVRYGKDVVVNLNELNKVRSFNYLFKGVKNVEDK
jgi:hypothetical protein